MNTDIQIRPAMEEDAVEISALIRQLGYEISADVLHGKLASMAASAADNVLVAESEGRLVACMGLHVVTLLHVEGALGRITALVIDGDHRSRGIGRELVLSAHDWFEAASCTRFEVTSGDHRERAHRFYERLGYVRQGQRLARTAT